VFGKPGEQDSLPTIDIPPQSLTSALLQLSDQLGLSVGFLEKLTAGLEA